MNIFEREIPLRAAADFFLDMKKAAEWTDPPDLTGELEGKFSCPVEHVLHQLKTVISAKFRLMIGYYTYAQTFRDHAWRAVKTEFYEHAEDELEGAEFYLKRATALGGPVHFNEIDPPPPSNNPFSILKMLVRGEQEGIAAQRELRAMVGEDNPMRIGIEEQLQKDQHHLDELWQIMSENEHLSLEEMGAEGGNIVAPAMTSASEVEPPLEEKAAAMRMSLALMKKAEGEAAMAPPAAPVEAPNFLQAELMGRQMQSMGEADFYRGKLEEQNAMNEQLQANTQAAQQQLESLQAQAAEASANIQAATSEAVAARDDALMQTMEAAKARIGAQQMRQSMLELASQDPQALGEAAMAPQPPMDGGMDANGNPAAPEAGMAAPPPAEGPAGMLPDQPTAPGAAPVAGEPDTNAPAGPAPGPDPNLAESTTAIKTGASPKERLIGALAGAGLGAGAGALTRGRGMEAQPVTPEMAEGASGFRGAVDTAKRNPVLMGGLTGAVLGASTGPMLYHRGKNIARNVKDIVAKE